MDARMRESFLRELMILQSTSSSSKSSSRNNNNNKQDNKEEIPKTIGTDNQLNKQDIIVDVTLLADSGTTSRTLTGYFVACDKNLSHIIIDDFKTPLGTQCSLLRLNDVIAITY